MPTSTPSIDGKILHRSRCAGELCTLEKTWPIHNVRHRGVFLRLCTSCVLKYNPGSFCTICFDFFKDSKPPPSVVVHCSSCPSLTHISCISSAASAGERNHLCPTCANPNNFSYFPFLPSSSSSPSPEHKDSHVDATTGKRKRKKVIDLEPSKVMLLASRIASVSMIKALGGFMTEAQRKAKEAVTANKRATEMLERSFLINNMEKEKTKKLEAMVVAPPPVSIERPIEEENSYQKKKIKTAAPAAGQQKRAQSRERDTLMKFQEPVSLAMVAAAAAAATSESSPGANYNNSNIRVDEERGGEGEAPPPSLTMIKEEDEEEEKKETKDSGFRQTTILPSPNQDPS
ncbi:hypothetical protein ZOSMA_467G00020 [Zostera marina]|uniref:RING-type domain-containing protein n=1 Tax=Zostera marina TaxID=29655 RepID=A0A0K9P095_ZOSMR|nr:hypothetical protein ZOSMA_467G00020 [Zostera marina]